MLVSSNVATSFKMEFLKISRRVTFWKILIHLKEFSIELQIAEIFPVTLQKSNSTTDAFVATSLLRGNIWRVESVFSLLLGGRLESSKKITLLKMFFWSSSKTLK